MSADTLRARYGDWALVTGASSGIGVEFARRLAGQGVNVILVARRKERLENLAEELIALHGIEAIVVPLDLTEPGFLKKLEKAVGDRHIGILVNNAGYGKMGPHATSDPEAESSMVLLNCWAPVVLTRHFLTPMLREGRGAVVVVGSVVAGTPMPYFATYAATKVFDNYFGQALYQEVKKRGVDVLVLNPGSTATEFADVAGNRFGNRGPIVRSAPQVVETALNALGRKRSVTDGWFNRLGMVLMKIVPKPMLLPMTQMGIGRMLRR